MSVFIKLIVCIHLFSFFKFSCKVQFKNKTKTLKMRPETVSRPTRVSRLPIPDYYCCLKWFHLRLRGTQWSRQLLRGFPPYTCKLPRLSRPRHRWSAGWSRSSGHRRADVVLSHAPLPHPWTTWRSESAWRGTVPWTSPFYQRQPRRTVEASVRTPELRSRSQYGCCCIWTNNKRSKGSSRINNNHNSRPSSGSMNTAKQTQKNQYWKFFSGDKSSKNAAQFFQTSLIRNS